MPDLLTWNEWIVGSLLSAVMASMLAMCLGNVLHTVFTCALLIARCVLSTAWLVSRLVGLGVLVG